MRKEETSWRLERAAVIFTRIERSTGIETHRSTVRKGRSTVAPEFRCCYVTVTSPRARDRREDGLVSFRVPEHRGREREREREHPRAPGSSSELSAFVGLIRCSLAPPPPPPSRSEVSRPLRASTVSVLVRDFPARTQGRRRGEGITVRRV